MKEFFVPKDLLLFSNNMGMNSDFSVRGFSGGISEAMAALTVTVSAAALESLQYVGYGSAQGTGNISVQVPLPAGIREGDLVLLIGVAGNNAGTGICNSTDFVYQATAAGSDTYPCRLVLRTKFMEGGETDITVQSGATYHFVCTAYVFRGVDLSIFDVPITTSSGGNSGVANCPSITPATDGAAVVAIGAAVYAPGYGLGTITTPSGFSDTVINAKIESGWGSPVLVIANLLQEAAATVDPDQWSGMSTWAQNSWAALTVALRPKQ